MPLLDGRDPHAIAEAARQLAAGALVALPTETVYGLGARADDDAAVAGIFAAKGRPAWHPLIVHVSDAEAARPFAAELGPVAQRLITACWPGPLTLIVRRAPAMAAAAAAGQDTIGLRCPSHPVAQALLRAAAAQGVPGVAAPSANRFGRVSPTTAAHVLGEFGSELLVLDGGPCELGIESTIVDVSRGTAVLLRPGVLTREALSRAAGIALQDADRGAPRAPGSLPAHYAPRARVRLMPQATLQAQTSRPAGPGMQVAVYSTAAPPAGSVYMHRLMPSEARAVARELFSVLRDFDALGAQEVWVQQPPDTQEWDGVRDRLQRAAAVD
jgi:L-threonylcarbamoyladenylate synthase